MRRFWIVLAAAAALTALAADRGQSPVAGPSAATVSVSAFEPLLRAGRRVL